MWMNAPKIPTKIVISSFELSENISSFEGSAWTDTLSGTFDTINILIDGIASTGDYFIPQDDGFCGVGPFDYTVTLNGHLANDVAVSFTGYNGLPDIWYRGPADMNIPATNSNCTIKLTAMKRAKLTTPNSFLNGVIRSASFGQGFLYDIQCHGGNSANVSGVLYAISTLDGCGTIQDYSDAAIGFYGYYDGVSHATCCDFTCLADGDAPYCGPSIGFPTYLSFPNTNKAKYVGTFKGNWQIAMDAPDPNWTLLSWTSSYDMTFSGT